MSQYTFHKKTLIVRSLPYLHSTMDVGILLPFPTFGIDQNNISAAGIEVGQGEVALSASRNLGLRKIENRVN